MCTQLSYINVKRSQLLVTMTKKFLPFFLFSVFSCDNTPKAHPAQNKDVPNFDADPNKFCYFENHFNELLTFLSNSINPIKKRSDITQKQIKKCVKYVVHFDDIKNFYNEAVKTQVLHQSAHDLICILASYYGDILNDQIDKYKENHNGKCPMEKLVNKVYGKEIKEIQEFKEVDIKDKKYHHSAVCNEMKDSLSQMLGNLMSKRADIAFLVAMAIVRGEKLSSFLDVDDDKKLCELLDDDPADYSEVLKKIFLDELELNDIVCFTPDVCRDAKKSQRDIFFDYFESDFRKNHPSISFQKVIRPYLADNKDNYVVDNLKEGVKEFFKTHYQKYPIRFQKFTLSLLTQYLKKVDTGDKKELCELLVLYLLNFYSTQQDFGVFVFNDMGQKMLRYDSFKEKDAKVFNAKIDEIVTFINDNYNDMDKDLFKEMTHKEITDGNKKIIEELKDQLNKGKRL